MMEVQGSGYVDFGDGKPAEFLWLCGEKWACL
ncbi:murein transglycosylase A [Providencia stuartii]|nr:murein transglycosylase A [Providencia stuartii]